MIFSAHCLHFAHIALSRIPPPAFHQWHIISLENRTSI